MSSTVHERLLQEDVESGVAIMLSKNKGMTPTEALRRVTKEMLQNNPFVPPTDGCPINDLPNELLAHIFYVGMTMEEEGPSEDDLEEDEYEDELDLLDWDSDDDEQKYLSGSGKGKKSDKEEESDSENEDDRRLAFQILVSHVCKHWRDVAIESPILWTSLHFDLGTSLDMAKIWLQRSKGHPLDIEIDCTSPDDMVIEVDDDDEDEDEVLELTPHSDSNLELSSGETMENDTDTENRPPHLTQAQVSEILDIIIPVVDRWKSFVVNATFYDSLYLILERFSKCSAAPLLELLEMYHNEDCEEFESFSPPELSTRFVLFGGNAPRLKSVDLWGVHLDWDASLLLLNNLHNLELAYHADDVRPSFETFSAILAGSPDLQTLSLAISGPSEGDWGTTPIDIPSVKSLSICHHEPAYIERLLPLLHLPSVVELTVTPPGRTQSLLAGLEYLKIDSLPSNHSARQLMLEQLVNLQSICLNCAGDEEEFFDRLMELKSTPSEAGTPQSMVFCPHLTRLMTAGIDGSKMKRMVEARKQGGAPLLKVSMSEEDDIEEKEEKWLREHLDEFDFHEPSDESEEELETEIDVDDIMDMD
ncbi:hypothetical protein D9757_003520 [Collybiopsis confluens]|uniref:F-box domain-containing protein n=1 Tax=Collybiopsis confluens TaxID=2823264 RepID=A0A8H5HTV5_9AGAR|nr:hypothetical protein D9757_003520 [Collybiopsis confluens]